MYISTSNVTIADDMKAATAPKESHKIPAMLLASNAAML